MHYQCTETQCRASETFRCTAVGTVCQGHLQEVTSSGNAAEKTSQKGP